MKEEIRIVVVGDAGVGKTSLITTLIAERFQEKVAPVVPPVTIPPQATPDKVLTHIIDTSSKQSDYPTVEEEIRLADSICIVYTEDDKDSFQRLQTFWLPEIRRIRKESNYEAKRKPPPVIIVANKMDLKNNQLNNSNLAQTMKSITSAFNEVEMCLKCSAKRNFNVHEMFFFAAKSVLYPLGVLYARSTQELTPRYKEALRRVFALLDTDKDGAWSDDELRTFQDKCFNAVLEQDDVDEIKKLIQGSVTNGLTPNGYIAPEGFFYLHKLFIMQGKLETAWAVLRKFGYGDDLKLLDSFVNPAVEVSEDQTVELSSDGYKFFTKLFKQHDRDQDGALSPAELKALFQTSPGMPPSWKDFPQSNVHCNSAGNVTLQGFLSMWSMTTLLDYQTTLRYLAYLGFEGKVEKTEAANTGSPQSPYHMAMNSNNNTTQAITVTRGRKADIKKRKIARNVFRCFVFGSPKCGKTSFLNAFIGKPFSENYTHTTEDRSVVNAVYFRDLKNSKQEEEKYLVMQEFANDQQALNKASLAKCDLICLLYDTTNSQSFEYVVNIQKKLVQEDIDIPCLYFATKADQTPVKQNVSVDEYFKGSQPPLSISVKKITHEEEDIFKYDLIQQIIESSENGGSWGWTVGLGLGVTALFVGGLVWWRYSAAFGGHHGRASKY